MVGSSRGLVIGYNNEISTYESVEIEIYMIRILEVGINLESSISS